MRWNLITLGNMSKAKSLKIPKIPSPLCHNTSIKQKLRTPKTKSSMLVLKMPTRGLQVYRARSPDQAGELGRRQLGFSR
jgi:hypothetical protein